MPQNLRAHTHLNVKPYLRGYVVRSAAEGTSGHSVCHVLFTHSEVSDLNVSLRVQHHIVQLQIPTEKDRHSKHP